jgi:hypothetical protein
MIQLIPLVTSLVTIVQMWAAGSHKVWAWPLGLANQVLWFAFIVTFEAWGLLPLMLALIVVYTRNWRYWHRQRLAMA